MLLLLSLCVFLSRKALFLPVLIAGLMADLGLIFLPDAAHKSLLLRPLLVQRSILSLFSI